MRTCPNAPICLWEAMRTSSDFERSIRANEQMNIARRIQRLVDGLERAEIEIARLRADNKRLRESTRRSA